MRSYGYTLVEVMMALAVLTLGASGVITMQKATLIANTSARNLATANGIAQAWVERVRSDALTWNEMGGLSDLTKDTVWLKWASSTPPQGGGGWFSPATFEPGNATPAGAAGADVMGADLYSWDPEELATAFCTQLRLTRFAATNADTDTLHSLYRTVRVEVRVFWDRQGAPMNCDADSLPQDFDLNVGRYGFVYLVSAAMENASPF